jgi:hypothetical protein
VSMAWVTLGAIILLTVDSGDPIQPLFEREPP